MALNKKVFKKKYKEIEDKASKGVLSEIERQKEEKGSTSRSVGEYKEAPGGGTPAAGGGRGAMHKDFRVVDSKEEADKIRQKEPNAKIRYNQPRTDDGQFTYNSANAKPLSTEKSRGYTKPPFLHGVDLTFMEEGAVFKLSDPNLTRIISSITLTADQLIDACKVYLKNEKGFAGLVGGAITKKGRTSQVEKVDQEGKVNKVDTSQLAQSTQQDLAKSAASVRKGPFTANVTAKQQKENAKKKKALAMQNIMKKQPQQQQPVTVGSNVSNQPQKSNVANTSKPQTNVKKDYLKENWSPQEAQNNPKQFLNDNVELIKAMTGLVPGMKASKAVSIVASGKVKNFEHFKKIVEKHKQKKQNV